MKFEGDGYTIDGNYAKLNRITGKVCCHNCNKVLILKCDDMEMIKTHISIKTKNGYVLRCGGCKMFNIIDGEKHTLAV